MLQASVNLFDELLQIYLFLAVLQNNLYICISKGSSMDIIYSIV